MLRLSALGDVCHVLPVVRTLQDAWPDARFTWIIGKLEHRLLGHPPDIEFVVFDKKAGRAGTVVEVLTDNGKSVEFGQKLFKIRKA